jgi:predicted transcriptional regulator
MTAATTETLLSKTQVLDSLKELPDHISADALIEHILFIQSVMSGIQQAEKGQTTSHDEAMREIRSWKK